MKTLLTIALLLTTSVCVGQEQKKIDTTHTQFNVSDSEYDYTPFIVYYYVNSSDLLMYNAKTDSLILSKELKVYIAIGIKLWDIYAKECYADSVYRRVHEPSPYLIDTIKTVNGGDYILKRPTMCMVDWECLIKEHYKDKWIHPNVPTLKGFVEFLRRKTK